MARLNTVEVTETYKMPDLVSKVEKGVALLDEKFPGWDKKITLKDLDLSDNDRCVVGQLAIKSMLNGPLQGYGEGINKVFPNYKQDTLDTAGDRYGIAEKFDKREEAHGFIVSASTAKIVREWLEKQPATHPWRSVLFGPANQTNFSETESMRQVLYDYLTAIWVQVVKERQRARRNSVRPTKEEVATARAKAAKKATAKKTVAKR